MTRSSGAQRTAGWTRRSASTSRWKRRRIWSPVYPAAEARRRALASFGGVERHREGLRDGRRVPVLEPIWQDVRFGARSLARAPGLAAVAAITIALGTGATTTVFSAVNAMLLRPLPFAGAERVGSIQESRGGMVSTGVEGMLIPYFRYLDYRAATGHIFASLAAHRLEEHFSLRLPEATLAVNGALTSGNYFETLRVRPALGRMYSSDDALEIVISHALWATKFASDPGVLGRTVGIDGRQVAIVGVAPRDFVGATMVADQLWAPIGVRGVAHDSWDVRMVPVGRLRDGVTFERATAAIDVVARRIPPNEDETTVHAARVDRAAVVPAEARAPVAGFFGMLLGMALLVLLIAAANIAGVMLARGFARRREIAVRQAMGASRARVVRHLLAESLILFALGGALGLWLAYLGTAWLARIPLPPQMPPVLLDLTPDARVLAFAIALTGITGIVFGIVPALRTSRPDLVPSLKSGAAGSVGGEGRARSIFVGAQVAFAVTLLLTATLFARSLQQGLRAEIGFNPDGMVAATIDLGPPLDYSNERGYAFHRVLLERVRALPGVQSAALSQYVLVSGSRSGGAVRRADRPDIAAVHASYSSVSPGYFATMGIELIAGRGFTDADRAGAPPVVVINRTLAERLWPGESPIGHMLRSFTREPAEIVGVTEAGRYTFVTEDPAAFVFLPYAQNYRPAVAIHARAPGAEAATLSAIADEVRAIDADIAIGMAVPVRDLVGVSLMPQRVAAQFVGAFGIVGLVLAALGIYGVLAYEVARRTRELGIRRALGASSVRVVGGVVRRSGIVAAAGCLVGTALGAGVAVAMRSLLYGIRPLDPVTFAAVPALLFAAALVASWVPAARASAVQPAEALRTE
jgi:predicted permease